MSRQESAEVKIQFLRALAFEIRRKRPAVEAMAACIEQEGLRGRHRMFRPVSAVLMEDGFIAAMKVAGFLSDEAAVVLAGVVEMEDHRLLAGVISNLADHHERGSDR